MVREVVYHIDAAACIIKCTLSTALEPVMSYCRHVQTTNAAAV
jgi:hypothetical protein